MAGLVRLPALCFGKGSTSFEKMNFARYEISPVEPLHDLKGHIKNVWELLPHHLEGKTKKFFLEEVQLALGKNLHIQKKRENVMY